MNVGANYIKKLEDIRANPEHWNQKMSIIEFKDKNNKPYWTKEYTWLPHWKRWKEATTWIQETNFSEYNCKIIWNENNSITLYTQNYFGKLREIEEKEQELLGKIRKKVRKEYNHPTLELESGQLSDYRERLAESFKFTKHEEFTEWAARDLYEEELEEWKRLIVKKGRLKEEDRGIAYDLARNDIAILWKKKLYWISNFIYINNYKLTVEIKAKVCPVFVRYPKWLSGAGRGVIEEGNLIKLTSKKLEDNQRMHYLFCGELGIKKIDQQAFGSYQPKFHLFRIRPITVSPSGVMGTYIGWANKSEGGLKIPYNVGLEPFDEQKQVDERGLWERNQHAFTALMAISKITGAEAPMRAAIQSLLKTNLILMIGPEEMVNYDKSYFAKFEEYEEELFPNNPTFTKWLKEQPHLWDHTTFQFYLFDKITMTANGRYLGVKERDGKFVLPYRLFINCSPGALYYRWQFGFIYVKLEISTQGNFQDYTNPMRFMKGFNFKIEGGILGSGGGFGMGMNWDSSSSDQAGKSDFKQDPSPEQEAHTERMFKSTFKDVLDKSVEPAMFNANTIDFNYSLGEFFNRLTDPVWFYRVEISELLHNRLNWANNKSPLIGLPFSWHELGTWTQKPGYWKWREVLLEEDTEKFFTNLMHRGYWLSDGQTLENPNLTFAHANNHIQVGSNAWNISQAEEEIIETREQKKETLMTADMTQADYSVVDYIGSQDANIWQQMGHRVHPENWGSGGRDCLGCLCGGGSHGNPNYSFEKVYNFTSGGSLTLKTRGSGEQTCPIPAEGGKVTFWAKGNSGGIDLETEKITRSIKLKPSITTKQEIDQEQLENETEQEELETLEQENEDEIKRELGGKDREREQEPEKEPEEEKEKETEQEQEKEQETEKEDERETEQETEREKEHEREKEKEQEEEQENEEENEGEEEDEL